MIDYIKQLVSTLERASSNIIGGGEQKIEGEDVPDFWALLVSIAEEVDRLDPRDFLPSARHDFVVARVQIRKQAVSPIQTRGTSAVLRVAKELAELLDQYGGSGSQAESKEFTFVNDIQLRGIVERDYKELSLILFPDGAWKSCVVMAGSILEAILYDQLVNNTTNNMAALASSQKPTRTSIDDWTLASLIKVSADIGVLNTAREDSIDQVLRDYRNFVHPKKEIRSAHPCTEAEALMAKGALDGVYNHLN